MDCVKMLGCKALVWSYGIAEEEALHTCTMVMDLNYKISLTYHLTQMVLVQSCTCCGHQAII